jgi:hypothetical protein
VAVFQNLDPRSCDGISLPSRSAFTPIFPLSSEPIFPSLFEAIYLHCEGVGVESIFNLLEPWISFSFFFWHTCMAIWNNSQVGCGGVLTLFCMEEEMPGAFFLNGSRRAFAQRDSRRTT